MRWSESVQQLRSYSIHNNLDAQWECPEGSNKPMTIYHCTSTGQDGSTELEKEQISPAVVELHNLCTRVSMPDGNAWPREAYDHVVEHLQRVTPKVQMDGTMERANDHAVVHWGRVTAKGWKDRCKNGWRLFYLPPYFSLERWGTIRTHGTILNDKSHHKSCVFNKKISEFVFL